MREALPRSIDDRLFQVLSFVYLCVPPWAEDQGVMSEVFPDGTFLVIPLNFGAKSIDGLDASALKGVAPEIQSGFRQALQVRGVELMSRTSGVLSGVHPEADIDRSLEAFDGAVKAMMDERLVKHS